MFGLERTVCACQECVRLCRYVSGMIIPADLERWQQIHERTWQTWYRQHLAASPGAHVILKGEPMRIRTLVPRRLATGRCHWLTPTEDCAIHTVAPYGCSHFDAHMDDQEGHQRSAIGLWSIYEAWQIDSLYARVWRALAARGQTVAGPDEARANMRKERS